MRKKVICKHCRGACLQPAWRNAKFCSGSCRTKYCNAHRPKGERHSTGSCDPSVQSPTLSDISWAAGIYEGEGHIQKPPPDGHSQRVCVAQKDLWLLRRLKKLFGGSIYLRPRCSYWYISGKRARGFAFTIYSFLSPWRKLQIRKALGCA